MRTADNRHFSVPKPSQRTESPKSAREFAPVTTGLYLGQIPGHAGAALAIRLGKTEDLQGHPPFRQAVQLGAARESAPVTPERYLGQIPGHAGAALAVRLGKTEDLQGHPPF